MEICQRLVPQLELVPIFKLQMKLWKFRHIQAECQDVFVDQASLGHFVEMLLNEDRALEGTPRRFAWVSLVVPLLGDIELLLLDADEHIGKKIALKLLPRHLVLTNAQSAIQSKLAESKAFQSALFT